MKQGIDNTLKNMNDGNIVIVAHGGIFSHSIQEICPNMEKSSFLSLESKNCSITKIEVNNKNFRLKYWAKADHMSGSAAKQVNALPED